MTRSVVLLCVAALFGASCGSSSGPLGSDGGPRDEADAGRTDVAIVSPPSRDTGPDTSGWDASVADDAGDLGDAGSSIPGDIGPADMDAGPTDMASTAPFFCLDEGLGRRGQGEDCGCEEDCSSAAPRCARNLLVDFQGPSYCTTDCVDGGCQSGFSCLDFFGLGEPFCERCVGSVGDLGDSCICADDCGSTTVGSTERALQCRGGVCSLTDCIPFIDLGCPEDYSCELNGIEPLCVACVDEATGLEGSQCGCQRDCESELQCAEGTCRRPCDDDADCAVDSICGEALIGASFCTPTPPTCDPSASGALGDFCGCDAACGAEAPECVQLTVTSSFSAGFCTLRPCDRSQTDACGTQEFECCELPFVFEPTCLDSRLAGPLSAFLSCGP